MKQKKEPVKSKIRQWNSSNQSNKKEKKIIKSEHSLKDLWDNIRWTSIHIIGDPEGDEGEKIKNKKRRWKSMGFNALVE